MSLTLHNAFITDASKVREAIGNLNEPSFSVSVTMSGRTLSDADQCKITYKVSSSDWGSNAVEGDTIEDCLFELMRRMGWNKVHAPLALAAPRTPA